MCCCWAGVRVAWTSCHSHSSTLKRKNKIASSIHIHIFGRPISLGKGVIWPVLARVRFTFCVRWHSNQYSFQMRNKFVIQSKMPSNGNETGCFLCWLPLIQNYLKWFGEFKVNAKMEMEKHGNWRRIRAQKKGKNQQHSFQTKSKMNEWKSTKRFCYSTLLSIIDVSTTLRHFAPLLMHLMKPIKVDLSLFYVLSKSARKNSHSPSPTISQFLLG